MRMLVGMACLTAAILVTIHTRQSLAYNLYTSNTGQNYIWQNGLVTFRYRPSQFNGEWLTGLEQAIALWNESPAAVTLTLQQDDATVGHGNGQSEIWFGSASTAYCQNSYDYANHRVVESDVVFGTSTAWTVSELKTDLIQYGGAERPFQNTAIHEIGHAIPLAHENREYNIMGMDFKHVHVNGETARTYIGEDAADAAIQLYGSKATPLEDISVSHWCYLNASGEYSDHRRTVLRQGGGGALGSVVVAGEPVYSVSPGSTVEAEFTYENNGSNSHANVPVGFYLSDDSTVTTLDNKIGQTAVTFDRGDVDTRVNAITIPQGLPAGDYWLGVIVDDSDSISEGVEVNNATYIRIRI